MNEPVRRSRPTAWAIAVLALLAYVPALTAAPGRMPADSKLYLYLDPGRFMRDAASTFDPLQFAGWVPHQHVAYLWPAGPWFWLFETLGVPDWVAHRLWIGTLMVAAGLGVRWCARLLGLNQVAALAAAVVYQVGPYVLPYVSRTSVMLLPWAGLGWIMAFTIRATRRHSWGDPAAIALVVFTVGAVNATALAMIIPAPVLWLIHSIWNRSLNWRRAAVVSLRVTALTVPVCAWWITMLMLQGRHGAPVLPYSESLADVSLTATSSEVWRGLGYWLFYVRDPYAATTSESLRYLASSKAILVSYAIPVACLTGLVFTRWTHRRFAGLLVAVGALLAVGVHPSDDRSPLMRLVAGGDDSGLALALRSSTRALPVMTLGLALAAGALVTALAGRRIPRFAWRVDATAAVCLAALAVMNLPSLWTGAFVDPALDRDQEPPVAWAEAAATLDASGTTSRVLQLPGAEFGAFRWGYTVDQPLPGLTDKPLVTRDLLPLGSPGAMDLLYALDDRFQDGVFEPASLAPVARWLGADSVLLANDVAFDRFRTARPQIVADEVAGAPSIMPAENFGRIGLNAPDVAMADERGLGDPRASAPLFPVVVHGIGDPGTVVRASDRTVVVSGSGDGLVDAAAAGLVDGGEVVRYSASLTDENLVTELDAATGLIVTDSNRDRARHWRSAQDTTGYTESDQPGTDLLRDHASDARLPVFADAALADDPVTQTITRQIGPVVAAATSYGEPFAYLPEHRPFMAIDGDPSTAWLTGEHGDPIGERIELTTTEPISAITLSQPVTDLDRRITRVTITSVDPSISVAPDAGPVGSITVQLDDRSWDGTGQTITLAPPIASGRIAITIDAVAGGVPDTASAAAGVGFTEIATGLDPTIEVTRPPHDALAATTGDNPLVLAFSRLRVDPMDGWRSDPEPMLRREFDLPGERTFDAEPMVRVDARATDAELASVFGWPASASTRLTGSIANAGIAALDGDDSTAWITGFGQAAGATLTIDNVTEPIDRIGVRQPVGTFTRVTAITLRAGGEERSAVLTPDAAGGASAVIEPPLPPGRLDIVLVGVEPAKTTDRRFGDVRELPAAISELEVPGWSLATSPSEATLNAECLPFLAIDGTAQLFSVTITAADATIGRGATATPCGPSATLGAGTHRVESTASGLPLTVDRVVLNDGFVAGSTAGSSGPVAEVVDGGRFERTIRVTGCESGCWLVFGEGFNTAWTAPGLGEPQLVDGGFNGWRLEGSDSPIEVTVRWTAQRWLNAAFVLTLLAVAAAVVLAIRDRRASGASDASDTADKAHIDATPLPSLLRTPGAVDWRSSLRVTIALVVLSALLIDPTWALAGLITGLAAMFARRRRLTELAALTWLIAVGILVAVRERRAAPPPNGGWPSVFESFHGLGMFAIVCFLASALFADDAFAGSAGRSDGEHLVE